MADNGTVSGTIETSAPFGRPESVGILRLYVRATSEKAVKRVARHLEARVALADGALVMHCSKCIRKGIQSTKGGKLKTLT